MCMRVARRLRRPIVTPRRSARRRGGTVRRRDKDIVTRNGFERRQVHGRTPRGLPRLRCRHRRGRQGVEPHRAARAGHMAPARHRPGRPPDRLFRQRHRDGRHRHRAVHRRRRIEDHHRHHDGEIRHHRHRLRRHERQRHDLRRRAAALARRLHRPRPGGRRHARRHRRRTVRRCADGGHLDFRRRDGAAQGHRTRLRPRRHGDRPRRSRQGDLRQGRARRRRRHRRAQQRHPQQRPVARTARLLRQRKVRRRPPVRRTRYLDRRGAAATDRHLCPGSDGDPRERARRQGAHQYHQRRPLEPHPGRIRRGISTSTA